MPCDDFVIYIQQQWTLRILRCERMRSAAAQGIFSGKDFSRVSEIELTIEKIRHSRANLL